MANDRMSVDELRRELMKIAASGVDVRKLVSTILHRNGPGSDGPVVFGDEMIDWLHKLSQGSLAESAIASIRQESASRYSRELAAMTPEQRAKHNEEMRLAYTGF